MLRGGCVCSNVKQGRFVLVLLRCHQSATSSRIECDAYDPRTELWTVHN